MYNRIVSCIKENIEIKQTIIKNVELQRCLCNLVNEIVSSIENGNKLVLCGNGGSASDALHFAGEIVGRFQKERAAWPAVVLNSDVATMTAIANDYGYEDIFARQAEAHINKGDIFIGISTSGNSENVYKAIEIAKTRGAKTVAFLGKDGGKIGKQVDYPIVVPCMTTARVQECHIMLIHIVCELVEEKLESK